MREFKPTVLDRAIAWASPKAAWSRMQHRQALTLFGFDGARVGRERKPAPTNQNPNDSRIEQDRIKLMWEARNLQDNFPVVSCLNRKYAQYVAPNSYQAQTGDEELNDKIEAYLNEEFFPNCDFYGRFHFFELCQFAISGTKVDGDHGWAIVRDGAEDGMKDEEKVKLPIKFCAVEGDLLGNALSANPKPDNVGGVKLDKSGRPFEYEIYKRPPGEARYVLDRTVLATDFIHFLDPLRVVGYRGISHLARMMLKKHASISAFIKNSQGAIPGAGELDPFVMTGDDGRSMTAQNMLIGSTIYGNQGEELQTVESHMPSGENQYLIDLLIKFVAMCYNLPVSFAVDAVKLGGVSMRLESQQALAEFIRARFVFCRRFDRAKNIGILDGLAKGRFGKVDPQTAMKGRWGYVAHPTPDIANEARATTMLLDANVEDPLAVIESSGQDPQTVVTNKARFAKMKKEAAEANDVTVAEAFAPATSSGVADIQKAKAETIKADSLVDSVAKTNVTNQSSD
jgi:capsid protein